MDKSIDANQSILIDEDKVAFKEEGWLPSIYIQANISKNEHNKIIAYIFITSLLLFILAVLSNRLLFPTVVLPTVYVFINISRRAYKRVENFERDYPVFLLSLASSVRTGLDPLSALILSEKLFDTDSEVRKELYKLKLGIERGKPEIEAIQEFATSIRHPDVKLFRTGYLLARREGSSLAECLQRLARVTRQRQSFRRKIKGAIAMQRLSAFGIGGCAVLISIIQAVGNPRIVTDAFAHPLGMRLMIAGVILIFVGLLWMIQMTRSHI